jgi:Transposase, Mutator family
VVETTMDLDSWVRKQLEQASPDLLRAMVRDFAEALMGVEADALCGAPYGERSPARVTKRNGYRERDWDARVGSIELAVPKLRSRRRTRVAGGVRVLREPPRRYGSQSSWPSPQQIPRSVDRTGAKRGFRPGRMTYQPFILPPGLSIPTRMRPSGSQAPKLS